jgi:hypothetical protein
MRVLVLVGVLSAALFFQACGGAPKNANENAPARSEAEIKEDLLKRVNGPIENATAAYVKSEYPEANLLGISIQRNDEDTNALFGYFVTEHLVAQIESKPAIVAADLGAGKERTTVYLAARPFINNQGQKYWKLEPLTAEARALILLTEPKKSTGEASSDLP